MNFDVVVVGAGPAGLSAAIRLKQLKKDMSVCVVEKGAEVGAHILSGAVMETRALDELIPQWKEKGAPIKQNGTSESFYLLLGESSYVPMPNPPAMHNQHNFIVSLGAVTKWLAKQCEELGVEIYPGFACSELVVEGGKVAGVATADVGISKSGQRKANFARGMELIGRQTIFAEGSRGSLTKELLKKFGLASRSQPQIYALGVKEIWEVQSDKFRPGRIVHTAGWPADLRTYAGSFMYHWENRKVAIGMVVGLDYRNPYLSPFEEFQKWKRHAVVSSVLSGGKRIAYGARTLVEGGIQSIPKLSFPGGVLVGDCAGFVNVPKIKGIHNAMKSGMVAAECVSELLLSSPNVAAGAEALSYEDRLRRSWVWKDLWEARNVRPSFATPFGFLFGLGFAGADLMVVHGRVPFTLRHHHPDHAATQPARRFPKGKIYTKPDRQLTFDVNDSLILSGTNHNEDQPPHLKLSSQEIAVEVNYKVYAGLEGRYCPARVYEFMESEEKGKKTMKLNISAQNCLHCKACDIKDPKQNITWTVPEGGGGPSYGGMM